MAKKSKSKKSKGKKAAKSGARQAEAAASDEAVLGRTIDEVYNYLDAINKQTLGRIEGDTKAIRTDITNLGSGLANQINLVKNEVIKTEEIVTRIETSVKIELTKILQEAKNIFSLVSAIKVKTDRLP